MGKRYDKEFKIEAVRLASEPGNTQAGIERDLSVGEMCRVFSVSRSGYYRWRGRPESRRAIENRRLDAHIKAIFKKYKGRYGSPKITDELNDMGFAVGKNRVAIE